MNSWDDLKGNVSGWFDTAAHRTDRLTRLGVRAYDRYGINRDLDRHLANLGTLVYRKLADDPSVLLGEDAAIRAAMGKIARLQDELSCTQSEMDDLRVDLKSKPAGTPPSSDASAEPPESPSDGSAESENANSEPSGANEDAAKSE